MKQKMSKGTIARWVFAVLFLLAGIGSFDKGTAGLIAGILMIGAAFLMSPLSAAVPTFYSRGTLPVLASVAAVIIGGVVLPQDKKPETSAETPTRIAENQNNGISADEESSTEDTDTALETTSVFEIHFDTTGIGNADSAADRAVPQEPDTAVTSDQHTESTASAAATSRTTSATTTTTTTTKATIASTTKATTVSTTSASTTKTTTSTQAIYTWVLNTSTKKFHYKYCRDVPRIDAENYREFTGTYEQVIAMGYSECGHCNPHG